MKIALAAPAGAMHRYNGLFHKNLHYAPITLALLAALVPEALHAQVKIYDETAEAIPLDLDADVVAMTCITGTAVRVYRFADYFRSRGITVILGGVHPSLMPEEAKEHADCVITGLGDSSFPQALNDLKNGTLKPFYHQGCDETLACRPLPRKDLLKKKKYITLNTVEAIRGCCHSCSFCAYPKAFGKRILKRPVEEILEEIRSLKGKIVIFPDVNLIADRKFAKELFTALIPLKKWWFGLTTTVIMQDEELLALMKKSGCKGLLIGFESVNQETQESLGKGLNQVQEYKNLMNILHRHGIMSMGCFAFGSNGDQEDVFRRTVELCVEAKIDLPRFAVITPFPATDYHRELEEQGRIVERNWSMYDVEHVVYKPKNMSKTQLEEGLVRAWKESYSLKNIIRRIDWKNFFHINILYVVYLAVNIGYRKYAKEFEIYSEAVMADNRDIPIPDSCCPQEMPKEVSQRIPRETTQEMPRETSQEMPRKIGVEERI